MTTSIAEVQRAISQATAAGNKPQIQALRQLEREIRAEQRAQAADEKEQKRRYLESREREAELRNTMLGIEMEQLDSLLAWTLTFDDRIDFDKLLQTHAPDPFQPGSLAEARPAPQWSSYDPVKPTGIKALFKGRAYQELLADAKRRFDIDSTNHASEEAIRIAALTSAREAYGTRMWEERKAIDEHNADVERLRSSFSAGDPAAIDEYFGLVLTKSIYPDTFPREHRVQYMPESRQLVVEQELPTIKVVPTEKLVRFIKTRDEMTSTARPAKEVRATYANVIAQLALRTLHEVFEADAGTYVDTVVFNGMVSQLDPATGNMQRPCVITVRTTRDVFLQINLAHVDPMMCLRNLKASVSRTPEELTPVRPILDFDMTDKRFVNESNIISAFETRQNLLDLSPTEFEVLIQNLFQQMGLDAKQTRPSRDGGVDCVAYDQRAILGGKVVIQAKRYRNTVDVSSVRDLFGTMQNEGANKGILVTTSGYGSASYEFAKGKPLELIDGGQLLFLLKEHLDVDARIIMTD
ncbi:MAG: restriction endonuclease [Thermomicrobiales bacterium]